MPERKKDPESPATTSEAYDFMNSRWATMDVVLGGTETMRAAGEMVLPQHERETDDQYEERRIRATLFNVTDQTLQSLVGRPFSDPVTLGDDIPGQIRSVLESDIDGLGNDLQVFARNWFEEGLSKAFAHVLIDVPAAPEGTGPALEEGGNVRTLRDDQGRSPYWILIHPENVIFMSAIVVNGREVLDHVRIAEIQVTRVGFAFTFKQRIRVFNAPAVDGEMATFQVWELQEKKKAQEKDKWEIIEEGELGVPFIPLVTFYTDREALGVGKPPLLDLADLNIAHFQSDSDQVVTLTVARFPILAAIGNFDDSEGELQVGPKKILVNPDPNGDFKYVEHQGKAIEAGRQYGLDLVGQMEGFGGQFLTKKPGNETATARALDSAEATSPLQDMTFRFIDALEEALDMTAIWLGIQSGGGSVEMATEFGPEESDAADLNSLDKANTRRVISDRRYATELQRRGVLSDDYDFEEDQAEVASDKESALAMMPDIDPNPDDDDDDDDPLDEPGTGTDG